MEQPTPLFSEYHDKNNQIDENDCIKTKTLRHCNQMDDVNLGHGVKLYIGVLSNKWITKTSSPFLSKTFALFLNRPAALQGGLPLHGSVWMQQEFITALVLHSLLTKDIVHLFLLRLNQATFTGYTSTPVMFASHGVQITTLSSNAYKQRLCSCCSLLRHR